MNTKELALVSTATIIGAVASALTIRFFFNPKKHFARIVTSPDGVVVEKASSQSPFDPCKRKGLVDAEH